MQTATRVDLFAICMPGYMQINYHTHVHRFLYVKYVLQCQLGMHAHMMHDLIEAGQQSLCEVLKYHVSMLWSSRIRLLLAHLSRSNIVHVIAAMRWLPEEWLCSTPKVSCGIPIVVLVPRPSLLVQCVEVIIEERVIKLLVVDMRQSSVLLCHLRVPTTPGGALSVTTKS